MQKKKKKKRFRQLIFKMEKYNIFCFTLKWPWKSVKVTEPETDKQSLTEVLA